VKDENLWIGKIKGTGVFAIMNCEAPVPFLSKLQGELSEMFEYQPIKFVLNLKKLVILLFCVDFFRVILLQ